MEHSNENDVISCYTAEQAVEDGILIEVDRKLSEEAGFKWPVRISAEVHRLCTPPESNKIQTYTGRLWDVLFCAWTAILRARDRKERMAVFTVRIGPMNHTLWALVDGTSGPAIHIITPEEY
jgi:predicted P-loop ATPase/GTPase